MKKGKLLKLFVVTVCLNYSAQILPLHSIVAEATSAYGEVEGQGVETSSVNETSTAVVEESALETQVQPETPVVNDATSVGTSPEVETQPVAEEQPVAEVEATTEENSQAADAGLIMPMATKNGFEFFVDGREIAPSSWYDLPTHVTGRYVVQDETTFVYSYQLILKNQATGEEYILDSTDSTFDFDVSSYPDGIYSVQMKADGAFIMGGVTVDDSWSTTFVIELKKTDATVTVDRYYNPTSADLTFKGDANSWVIKDASGAVVPGGSGTGDSIPDSILSNLPEGTYTIENTATAKTQMGSEVPPTTKTGSFSIRHPESTTKVDNEFNPESVTGGQKIPESTLSWEIKDSSGAVVKSGAGSEVPQEIIKALEEGTYTVEFTETSPEGETHTSKGTFKARYPQSSTTVDREYNPETITGGQKLSDSKLTWEIKDSNGKVVESGTGSEVPSTVIEGLVEGTYTVEFTETSTEDLTSITAGNFVIRYPESTTTVDREYNPESVTGGQKIPESTLTWEIKDSDGIVVASGTGAEVPQEIISNLKEGTYTAEFTETSPEGETSLSTGSFAIRHPKSTTAVDKPLNPESIKGTQTILDSTLTWEIKDSLGNVVASGSGDTVPIDVVKGLEGDYTVEFTETSPEGETHTSIGNFKARYPQSTTTIDKPVNPSSITGGQKLPDSTLKWEIKDSKGNVISSGSGATVPQNILDGLAEGSYTAEFTETSTEGEISVTSGGFLIRHPEASVTIDKQENPTSITGGQKIPESTLTWAIKDSKGTVIAEGSGATVPQEVLAGLAPGSYTVEFTETSPEGEVSIASQKFTITDPAVAGKTDPVQKVTVNNPTAPNKTTTTGKSTLPQTGESDQTWMTSLGTVLGLTGLVAFMDKRKKRKNS